MRLIPLNLAFFQQGGQDKDSKTEDATPKKKQDARKEGQVAKSQEVVTAVKIIGMFFALRLFAGWMLSNILYLHSYNLRMLPYSFDAMQALFDSGYISWLFTQVLLIVGPLLAISFLIDVVINLVQVGWEPTLKPLMPKPSKLNPISGFKRIFSMQSVVNLLKSIAKLSIIGVVVFFIVRSRIGMIPAMLDMALITSIGLIGGLIIDLALAVGAVFIFVAAADYFYTRYKHLKDLKMTKQEVKDEYKQMEGDPLIKGKIRRKMQEVSMRRMMQNVPEADVVITNPTHYAVALRYNNIIDKAPVVVAKGVDFMAKRIREKAREHDIVIVENPPLARTLYSDVEVGEEIPVELWEAVVEVLAYVFKLRERAS
ncbi:MAG: flagellar biosynthesis protein FlhB [Turicibacter sp.]|nr:flagellar biosynthesis protein FlhB [Turicibacter sp.]